MQDLIFSTENDLVSEVIVGEYFAGTDHHMIWCTVDANVGSEAPGPMEPGTS